MADFERFVAATSRYRGRRGVAGTDDLDGKRLRRTQIVRRTIDIVSDIMVDKHQQRTRLNAHDVPSPYPSYQWHRDMLPLTSYRENPATCFTTKYVHTSVNKERTPINTARWTPDARRVITGATSGELTTWEGLNNGGRFETIMQAHEAAIRDIIWTHDGNFMLGGDDTGVVKYFEASLNNVRSVQCHQGRVNQIAVAPTDLKFGTASDDGTLCLWDFITTQREAELTGHLWDVKCTSWHPRSAMLASGSRDQLVKLWDPRQGRCLATIHGHKSTVQVVEWNANGNWLLTGGRDHLLKLHDIRRLSSGEETEVMNWRGQSKDVTVARWHPIVEEVFVSASSDGQLLWWMADMEEAQAEVKKAHEGAIWGLDWHPAGHVLVTGSSDYTVRWWTRNRPGSPMADRFQLRGHGMAGGDEGLGADWGSDDILEAEAAYRQRRQEAYQARIAAERGEGGPAQ